MSKIYHVINELTQLDINPDDVKKYGYMEIEPRRISKVIPVDELTMDNSWPKGCNVFQIKERAELNSGGQLYALVGGGDTPGSGFWVPVRIDTPESDETLSDDVSGAFDLVTVIDQAADDFFTIPPKEQNEDTV